MNRTIMLDAAQRIGRRAGFMAAACGLPHPNPFEGKCCDDLAEAWQDGYDHAIQPWPSAEQQQ